MKTTLVMGLVVALGVGVTGVYVYLKNRNQDGLKSKLSTLKKLLQIKPQLEIRKEDEISMRTFGKWIKEHDFPSFTGYKFFIITGLDIDKYAKKNNPDCEYAYGFCITDAQFNVIDGCIYTSRSVEPSFINKITDYVCEIKIQ